MHTLFEPTWPACHLVSGRIITQKNTHFRQNAPTFSPTPLRAFSKKSHGKHVAHAAFGAGPTSRTKRRNPSRPQVHPYPGRVRCARSFKRGGGIRANNGYATGRSHQSRLCLVVGFFPEHVLQWWRAADVGYEGWGADVVLVLQRF